MNTLDSYARSVAIQPTSWNILAVVADNADKIGSIYVPGNARVRPNTARVMAVGPGRFTKRGVRVPMETAVGDLIAFDAYKIKLVLADGMLANAQGTPYAAPGELIMITEAAVHGVLKHRPPCYECNGPGTPDVRRFTHVEKHWYCSNCHRMWGRTALMTYSHQGAEVAALIGACP